MKNIVELKKVLSVINFLLLFAFSSSGAEVFFSQVYKGDGTSYVEESNSIRILTSTRINSSNVSFVSYDESATVFNGNNVVGYLKYTNSLGQEVKILVNATRPVKDGNTKQGLYVAVMRINGSGQPINSSNGVINPLTSPNSITYTGEAYVFVAPGHENYFNTIASHPTNNNVNSSSDQVDTYLNGFLTDQSVITLSGTLNAFASCFGAASAPQSLSISGTNLSQNITVTAPTGYEISTAPSGTYSSTLTFTRIGTSVTATTFYIRLSSTAVNGAAGNLEATSTNAATKSVSTGEATVTAAPIAGTISGTTSVCASSTTQLSVTSSALDFDGTNDHVTAPAATYFNDDTYTIEGWALVRSHNSWQRLIDFGTDEARNNVVLALSNGTSGNPALHLYNGSGQLTALDATEALPLNQWVHVAAVRNGNSAFIYINGRLVTSTNSLSFTTPNINRTTNYIGRSLWGFDQYTNGEIGEVRIWNTARTQEQIRSNMHQVLSASSELELYYRFNQGVENGSNAGNTTITDFSGNNRTGNLVGFALTGTSSNWSSRNNPSATGTWSSSATSVAIVNSATGLVTGVVAGTASITYTVAGIGGCTNATSTSTVTVTAQPVVPVATAIQSFCEDANASSSVISIGPEDDMTAYEDDANIGKIYKMTITGATTGGWSVWGTDVYTHDS